MNVSRSPRETPEVPAPPTEPPAAARAFGPLGSKLPEGPRNASSRRPTRQRAFNRAMRRLVVIQTEAENRATCRVEISLELIASLVTGAPARMPTPPMAAAVMLILKTRTACSLSFPWPLPSAFVTSTLPASCIGFMPLEAALCCRLVSKTGSVFSYKVTSNFRFGLNTYVLYYLSASRQRRCLRPTSWFVNQRKQIRNTNEHFAKSHRNMPRR